ncbi:cyclin-dependent kinase inhibitor 1 [Ornithorhynchus anatinus]|nr:cyclin-dependent kinase inhibitor 1 [Ornithorhynchus anatinus]
MDRDRDRDGRASASGVAGRSQPIACSGKLCRNLFGPVDAEQLRQEAQALLQSCADEAQRRWNFDFITETPLEGDFAWERVRDLDLPALYLASPGWRGREGPAGKWQRARPASPALVQISSRGDHVDLSLSCAVGPPPQRQDVGSPANSTPRGHKRRQTSMTDFYHSKRRLVLAKTKP